MKDEVGLRKQELIRKIGLSFEEVSPVFSEETLQSMLMTQIVGGSGTDGTCTFKLTCDHGTCSHKSCDHVKVCSDDACSEVTAAPTAKPTTKPTPGPGGGTYYFVCVS